MLRVIATLTLAFVTAIALALIARPTLRAAIIAEWNDPAKLPVLPSDPRIHHEPAAYACAERIASLLPMAMKQIEAVHGRPFAKPPLIGVYASYPIYARANGLGDAGIAGVTRAGRALLSPTLCDNERERLASVLTHELSHVHFFGWRPRKASRPPPWFTEGLAVAASEGGGAEGVSDDDARRALRTGVRVILDDGAWTDFAAIRFEREPDCAASCDLWTFRQRLAFRQTALFIAWLRAQKPEAFQRLLRDLEHGGDFDSAYVLHFGSAPNIDWERFIDELTKT
jgi:hypothetical protein